MDIKLEIDFDYPRFKENLLSLRNYISLGFRCEDIDFKNAAIASIDRMMEEVSDGHDVNFFDALQNVIDNLSGIDTVRDVHDICCEFYHIMDENERVMHREFFERLKKYREGKIERVVPLTDHELIVMGNRYFDLKTGDECVVDSIIGMSGLRYGADTCAVLYVDRLGNRIACPVDDFRKKFGVKKEHEIRIDGKVMGPDYGKYFYSPRGNMWAVTLCTYDCDDGRMFEKIELYRTEDEAREAAFRLNTDVENG